MLRLHRWSGVCAASLLTAVGCVVFALLLAKLMYPPEVRASALHLTPWIALMTAFPVSFFVWSKVRENILLSRELRRLVNRDRLTDVSTRDHFFALFARDPGIAGCVLMIDIDHFKTINDAHGHLVGDEVIRHVAATVQGCVRDSDIVCRFGGEEFLVFLVSQAADAGGEVAERIRAAVFAGVPSDAGPRIPASVSIGGASKPGDMSIEAAIQEADAALYRAKKGGRNRLDWARSSLAA